MGCDRIEKHLDVEHRPTSELDGSDLAVADGIAQSYQLPIRCYIPLSCESLVADLDMNANEVDSQDCYGT